MDKQVKYDLIVVGAGGTGTYFLKEISRYLTGQEAKGKIRSLHIFDGDIVEEKNLERQCFTRDDIGRNKAAVMAEILNDAFDLNYQAHATYLLDREQLEECLKKSSSVYNTMYVPIVVGCVDNHACRLIMESVFEDEKTKNMVLFDSGNEFSTGEVVYSYKAHGEIYGPVRSDYFPEIKKGDLRTRVEIGCEELNKVAPQHIFTNMFAGNLLCEGIANLLCGKVTPGFVYFNSSTYESGFKPYRGKLQKAMGA